jgi:hypothetical protein
VQKGVNWKGSNQGRWRERTGNGFRTSKKIVMYVHNVIVDCAVTK